MDRSNALAVGGAATRSPRILLVGDSGVGKTCFVNSLNAVLRQGASSQAHASSAPPATAGGLRGLFSSPSRGGAVSPQQSASENGVLEGVKARSGNDLIPPPPTTIGVLCDAVCIKYGGAIKSIETVEIGGNRTFAPTARQVAYKSNAIAAVFLFYRRDSRDSIVNLAQWFDELKREVNGDREVGGGGGGWQNQPYSAMGLSDGSANVNSSSPMPYYSSAHRQQQSNNNIYNNNHNIPSSSSVNFYNDEACHPFFSSPQQQQQTPSRGEWRQGYHPHQHTTAQQPLKIVLVQVVNPKSSSSNNTARKSGFWPRRGGARHDYHYEEERIGDSGCGGYSAALPHCDYFDDEPTVLFRNTGLEPFGRFINRCAMAIWHVSLLLLSMLLLGPGQRVVQFRPPSPADVLQKIESDPLFCMSLTVEFASNSDSRIDFGESLDDIVQILANLSI